MKNWHQIRVEKEILLLEEIVDEAYAILHKKKPSFEVPSFIEWIEKAKKRPVLSKPYRPIWQRRACQPRSALLAQAPASTAQSLKRKGKSNLAQVGLHQD